MGHLLAVAENVEDRAEEAVKLPVAAEGQETQTDLLQTEKVSEGRNVHHSRSLVNKPYASQNKSSLYLYPQA
jgi:hypothetical protein